MVIAFRRGFTTGLFPVLLEVIPLCDILFDILYLTFSEAEKRIVRLMVMTARLSAEFYYSRGGGTILSSVKHKRTIL